MASFRWPTPQMGGAWLFRLLFVSMCLLFPHEGALASFANFSPVQRVQARLDLATAYFESGMFTFALEEVELALVLAPLHPESLALKGLLFLQQKRVDLAENYFQKASQGAPLSAPIAHKFGVFYCQNGQFEASFAKFKHASDLSNGLQKQKTDWVWGQCLMQNMQLQAANFKMSDALKRQPSLIYDSLPLVELKIKLGMYSEAEKILDFLNDSPSVSAQSVWLALHLAERQNQAVKKNHWGKMLGLQFPNSAQWRLFQDQVPHD